MNSNCIKPFHFLFTIFLLTGCKESTTTPPFNLCYEVKLINEDGSSPLKEHIDKIENITVNILDPPNDAAQVFDISYIDYPDRLRIQIGEWGAIFKENGNYEQEYILEIHYPDEIRKEVDILKAKIRFRDKIPSLIEAFCNDQEPKYMGLDLIYFEIKNI